MALIKEDSYLGRREKMEIEEAKPQREKQFNDYTIIQKINLLKDRIEILEKLCPQLTKEIQRLKERIGGF